MNYLSLKISAILLFVFTITSFAQITSNGFYTEPTNYTDNGPNDPIFFYTNINTASIDAPSGVNYQWFKYSTTSNSFELISGATGSNLSNIEESGYQVQVETSDGNINNYYCWNFAPTIQVDSIGMPFESCDNIRLTAYTQNKVLTYYNHNTNSESQTVDYGYNWTSVPTGPFDGQTGYTNIGDAPTEDTEYSVIVGGKFSAGLEAGTASYAYEAIAVEAEFSFESEGTADNEGKEGSAPMIVRFTDESSGKVNDWEWTFGDAGKDFIPDPIFTFQTFGTYNVVLFARNTDSGCESETDPEVFQVNEMVVKVPNAFTPFSSPGQNDEFRVLFRSVKKFDMLIYNRWGKRVYQSSNPEEGWNGRIGGQKAEPGVYFYNIEAEGYNKGESVSLEGAVHLIVN